MNFGVLARSLLSAFSPGHLALATSGIMLASCAHRTASFDSTTAAAETSTAACPPAPHGSAPIFVVNPKTHRSAVPLGTAADRIVNEVETGRLAQSGENYLVFIRRKSAAPASPQSLYGDAIALGRLRSKLKSVPGAPPSSYREATVHNGLAVIPIKGTLPAATTAGMVDTALTVDLIRSVRLNLPTVSR